MILTKKKKEQPEPSEQARVQALIETIVKEGQELEELIKKNREVIEQQEAQLQRKIGEINGLARYRDSLGPEKVETKAEEQ